MRDTEQLLEEIGRGDISARSRLWDGSRKRLQQMIAVRLDRRLAARVDPSDVVQEVLLKADQQLAEYLRRRPLPFYPWLRQIAADQLADLHRRHIRARRRSVDREQAAIPLLSDESTWELVQHLCSHGSTPSAQAVREETRHQVRNALMELPDRDREVLVLRHLERLSTSEIAAVLNISEAAVYTRHLRALQHLGNLLIALVEKGRL
jgi:RNA polymerase sigma-70 factor, ECF subfamily